MKIFEEMLTLMSAEQLIEYIADSTPQPDAIQQRNEFLAMCRIFMEERNGRTTN